MKEKEKSSLVDLGKRLLEASRKGHAEEVSMLMASGAPFTTDWVWNMYYSRTFNPKWGCHLLRRAIPGNLGSPDLT